MKDRLVYRFCSGSFGELTFDTADWSASFDRSILPLTLFRR